MMVDLGHAITNAFWIVLALAAGFAILVARKEWERLLEYLVFMVFTILGFVAWLLAWREGATTVLGAYLLLVVSGVVGSIIRWHALFVVACLVSVLAILGYFGKLLYKAIRAEVTRATVAAEAGKAGRDATSPDEDTMREIFAEYEQDLEERGVHRVIGEPTESGAVSDRLQADLLAQLPRVPTLVKPTRNGWLVTLTGSTTREDILPHLAYQNPAVCLSIAGGTVYRLRAIPDRSGHIGQVRWTGRVLSGPDRGEVREAVMPTDDLLRGTYAISPPGAVLDILWMEGGRGGLEILVERSSDAREALLSNARYWDKGVLIMRL